MTDHLIASLAQTYASLAVKITLILASLNVTGDASISAPAAKKAKVDLTCTADLG